MNILYYMEPKSVTGGVSNVAYHLSKALAKKVDITYFPCFKFEKRYIVDLLSVYKKFAVKQFEILHFNVVPTWINGGRMLLKFAKKRDSCTALNIHGIIPLEHKLDPALGPIPRIALSNVLRACKLADRIIVNSEFMRNAVINWYGVNREKIVVVPHGVDLKRFRECKVKLTLSGDPAVLYLGVLSMMKGVDILFHAIAKLRSELPKMRLHLVGSGDLNYFQLLAKKMEIEKLVVFHGWAAHSMVPAYYRSADFFVFPSKYESFGIVILEAMASGIPIIASRVGVAPEIIRDRENGILVEPNNPDMLARAILQLSHDSYLRGKISQNALKTATEYSWDNIANKYVAVYEDMRKES